MPRVADNDVGQWLIEEALFLRLELEEQAADRAAHEELKHESAIAKSQARANRLFGGDD